jgi:hypothetical protein|tara:strand:- start:18719 stop:18886 length:168 start_codon:yes stop_codon:yes gene_type:complete
MTYEVTIKLKVEEGYFYWDADKSDRQSSISEQIRNALYDLDNLSVSQVLTEEIED